MLAVAALGMASPILLLLFMLRRYEDSRALGEWALFANVVACSLLSLLIIARSLEPLGQAGAALFEIAQKLGFEPVRQGGDDVGSLATGLRDLAGRLGAVRRRLANQHPATGLPTREPFLEAVSADLKPDSEPALMAIVRFGDFDHIASFDRAAADGALAAFAVRLKGALRKTLPLAQVDRDCFAIWFSATQPERATRELKAVCYVLEQELACGEATITPSVAVSAAIHPNDADTATALLTCAFAALSRGDAPAGEPLAFFSSASTEAARRRFVLEQGLRQAIAREEFRLAFQPIVDVTLGRPVGAEALIRWRHEDLGAVSPIEFIPILEQTGLIEEVGRWVLHTACREARDWRRKGLSDLRVAVNLSANQFRGAGLAGGVVRTLEHHRLTPSDLEVELTETAAMQDSARTRECLEQLRALGVGVAIDDFGAGYSSLSYLKNLPFTKLKIDREFVMKVHERPDSQAICASLVALARGLDIELLAEGVEEAAELETLMRLGCHLFQGFYFAAPLESAQFVERLSDPAWLASLAPARPKAMRA